MNEASTRTVEILLVEDSPSDTDFAVEAFRDARLPNHLSKVNDGVEAIDFLRRQGRFAKAPRPDLILLDLNLPRKDGKEVLAEIKADQDLKTIPVLVLSTSRAEKDILQAYRLNANCYLQKPIDFTRFLEVIRAVENFWLNVVTLPPKIKRDYAADHNQNE
jgi:two-component system, chemotaxis family, response regulator Rcp1